MAIGTNIAGIILAVLTLVRPSILVPIKNMINEPTMDIYEIVASGKKLAKKIPPKVRSP
jgi:hypothetical protein